MILNFVRKKTWVLEGKNELGPARLLILLMLINIRLKPALLAWLAYLYAPLNEVYLWQRFCLVLLEKIFTNDARNYIFTFPIMLGFFSSNCNILILDYIANGQLICFKKRNRCTGRQQVSQDYINFNPFWWISSLWFTEVHIGK
jgi:hypothetical protein